MKKKCFVALLALLMIFLCACQSKEEKKQYALKEAQRFVEGQNTRYPQYLFGSQYDAETNTSGDIF